MKRKVGIIVVIILTGICIWFLFHFIYYSGRWYLGTTINGLEVSGQTIEESKQYVLDKYRDYTLTVIGRNGSSMSICGQDIGFVVRAGDEWEKIYAVQHGTWQIPLTSKGDYRVKLDVTFNRQILDKLVDESELVRGSKAHPIEKPESARASYDEDKGYYVCQKEVKGNQVNKGNLLKTIETAIQQGKRKIDIREDTRYEDVYKNPKISSEDKEISDEIVRCNRAVLRFLCWDMGDGVSEKITPKRIAGWVCYKNGKVTYDDKAISAWLKKFCQKYQTVGKTRTIKSHTGKKVKVAGGDYGWQIDYDRTRKLLKKLLCKDMDESLTEQYMKNPSVENRKALTVVRKPIYLYTAFRRNGKKQMKDWDLKNYTEISLAEQMVYVYRKGKVAFSCRCITGLPITGRITRTGTYYIKEHRLEYTMKGDDYRTHVKHWVRITWTGTGFHPATWQPWSKWSKTLYKTKGSHGCINLAPDDAEKIYHMVRYREAVFIHN